MTPHLPITQFETVHDYSLLEQLRQEEQHRPLPAAPGARAPILAALVLAALALAVALGVLAYALLQAPPVLVPGSFANATVVVDAHGRIVSVTQGAAPATVMMAPVGAQAGVAGPPPVPASESAAPEPAKKTFPWSEPAATVSPPAAPASGDQPDAAASPVTSGEPAKVVENFVKFQSVPFKTGVVSTGWRYADSNATEPEAQWCYYRDLRASATGLRPTVDLEEDAAPESLSAVGLTEAEYVEAQGQCQWFNQRKPDPTP